MMDNSSHDLDSLSRIRRVAALAFVVGLLACAVLTFLLGPDNRPSESLRQENQILREMNRLLAEDRAKVRQVLEHGEQSASEGQE